MSLRAALIIALDPRDPFGLRGSRPLEDLVFRVSIGVSRADLDGIAFAVDVQGIAVDLVEEHDRDGIRSQARARGGARELQEAAGKFF